MTALLNAAFAELARESDDALPVCGYPESKGGSMPAGMRAASVRIGHKERPVRVLGNAHGIAVEHDQEGKIIGFTGAVDARRTRKARGY